MSMDSVDIVHGPSFQYFSRTMSMDKVHWVHGLSTGGMIPQPFITTLCIILVHIMYMSWFLYKCLLVPLAGYDIGWVVLYSHLVFHCGVCAGSSESAVQMVDHAGVVFFQRSSSFTRPTCMAQLEKSESEINSWRLTWYNKANCGKDHLLIKTISTHQEMLYVSLFGDNLWIKIICPQTPIQTYPNYHMSHVMRKPVYAICEQQRRRSTCASAQSDQCLCCSLPC